MKISNTNRKHSHNFPISRIIQNKFFFIFSFLDYIMLATFKYIHIDKNSKPKILFSFSFNCKFSNSQLMKKMFFWLSEQVKLDIPTEAECRNCDFSLLFFLPFWIRNYNPTITGNMLYFGSLWSGTTFIKTLDFLCLLDKRLDYRWQGVDTWRFCRADYCVLITDYVVIFTLTKY